MERSIKRFELRTIQTDFPIKEIRSSLDAYNFIRQFYGDDIEIYESFFILMLNRAGKTTGYAKISQGGISGTVVDMKILAKFAVEALANSVIIAHNHPSGNLNPSGCDIELTTKVQQGLLLLDIKLFDHIILTTSGYYSFADDGRL